MLTSMKLRLKLRHGWLMNNRASSSYWIYTILCTVGIGASFKMPSSIKTVLKFDPDIRTSTQNMINKWYHAYVNQTCCPMLIITGMLVGCWTARESSSSYCLSITFFGEGSQNIYSGIGTFTPFLLFAGEFIRWIISSNICTGISAIKGLSPLIADLPWGRVWIPR